ncbi:MAG: threonine synthase [Gemmatimonadetes bacterium]|nr:threonine synthase [Gemmatimonadota bacterium]
MNTTKTLLGQSAALDMLRCRMCGTETESGPYHVCEECFGPLEVIYDTEGLRGKLTREKIASRPSDMWRYRELLPVAEEPTRGLGVGCTPLLRAPRLGKAIGIQDLWIKADSSNHPTQSFKDRVVAVALQRAGELGIKVVGCASTGNLANAVAAQAATAGLQAWIFIPEDLEPEKIVATGVHGARVIRVKGVYDDVNRLCAEVADRFGWGIVNVNLRAYYSEGSKSMGFEIAEQLGWTLPANVVVPMAGGSLITKLRKSFWELTKVGLVDEGPEPRIFGAQAAGCSPIVSALQRGERQVRPVQKPDTIARSLAIGNPADGLFALETMRETGGWGEAVSDEDIVRGIGTLATLEGVFTETAGGVTVSAAARLALDGRLAPGGPTVLCITGNGLKTPEAARSTFRLEDPIQPRLSEVERLVGNGAA